MDNIRKFSKPVFVAVVTVVVAGFSHSAAFAQTVLGPENSTNTVSATATSTAPFSNQGLFFPTFDSSLGTLQSVELVINPSFTSTVTVTNVLPGTSTGTASAKSMFNITDSSSNIPANSLSLTLSSPAFPYSVTGAGSQFVQGTSNVSGIIDQTYTAAAILAEFTGAGPGTIDLSTAGSTTTIDTIQSGVNSATVTENALVSGTVTYTYSAAVTPPSGVPEPAALSLLSMGLIGGMSFLRRQRKA